MIGSDYTGAESDYWTDAPKDVRKRKFRVSIEGNIASGKSTILKKLRQQKSVEVLVEPVDKWRSLSGGNLIGRMYEDAKRWGYLFQSYVLLTMMELHHKQVASPVMMLERSVFSARYCFVENLHKAGVLDDMEYACYCQLFDHMTQQNPPQLDLIGTGFYLRSSPEVCYQRLLQRGRKEEKTVTLEYLQSLHEHYENWLGNDKHHCWHGNTPVMVIDADEDCNLNPVFHTKHSAAIINRLGINDITG